MMLTNRALLDTLHRRLDEATHDDPLQTTRTRYVIRWTAVGVYYFRVAGLTPHWTTTREEATTFEFETIAEITAALVCHLPFGSYEIEPIQRR